MPLNDAQKAKLSTARSDLKLLVLAGQALLRGKANVIEEHAMAKVCNPGKTASTDKSDRGFLAFQGTLDRFCSLMRLSDTEGLHDHYDHACQDTLPRDALIQARLRPEMTGNTALANDHLLSQQARRVYLDLKAKYGLEALVNPGSLTLSKTVRKASKKVQNAEAIEMATLFAQHKDDPAALGAAIIAYHTNKEAERAAKSSEPEVQAAPIVLNAQATA